MPRRKDIIRVNDVVKVVTPLFFVRCGYPLDVRTEKERILREEREKLVALLMDMGLKNKCGHRVFEKTMVKIAAEIAYCRVRDQSFGGCERTIHTEELKHLKDKTALVIGIKFCKTGVYQRGVGHTNDLFGYGDSEYDPPCLKKEQTHKILEISMLEATSDPLDPISFDVFESFRKIEAIHTQKHSG